VHSETEILAFPFQSLGMDRPKSVGHVTPLHSRKGEEMSLEQMQALNIAVAAEAAETAAQLMPSLYLANKIGEISGKTDGLSDENNRLREKLKGLKKENDTLKQKIEAMESQAQKQGETIRTLESSQDKLQKELEKVKTAKDRLRIEIEEKTSKFSTENAILAEKVEALTKELEEVEKENKELKRRLEEMSTSNNSLRQDVDSMKEENQQLKDEVGNLKAEQKKINEKLECKETRLALGQVAWLLEAEIWKAVLPDQTMGYTGILKSMKRWLKKNSSSPKGKAAQTRWEDLKEKLNWDEEDHNYALKCLKELRREDAHPKKVDLEVARKQLNEGVYVADVDKKTCEDIIDMVVTARKLNNSK
jgi:DNA repair exonuclease SbcCD ATPase subunit